MSYNKETGMYEGFIYCITNQVNGKQYIGQTTQTIYRRWITHKSESKLIKNNRYLYNAFEKYGFDNFEITEIIKYEHSDINKLFDELNKIEIYYIDKLKTLKPNGYNMSLGGKNHFSIDLLKPVYQFDLDGNFINCYHSISEASEITETDGSAIVKVCKGKAKSTNKYIWSYNSYVNIENYKKYISSCKTICQYDLSGNFINKFNSIKDAANKYNLSRSNISNTCNGINNSCGGYVWRYEGDSFSKYKSKWYPTKSVLQYDLDNNLIKQFSSIKEAAESLNIFGTSIVSVCKGRTKTAGCYIWKYASEEGDMNAG